MNKRERILALLVGVALLALAAFFGARKVNEAIRARKQQIAAAEKAVRDKNQILQLSAEPAGRMKDYQRRSLPSDLEQARSLYQTWLLNLVKDAGFEDTQVSVLPTRSEKGIYNVLGFSVSGRGNMPKLVSFLHRFYSADLLHRVRRLHAKRVPGTKQLDLAVAIDAVSLPTADSTDKLNEQAVRKLAHGDLAAYLKTILERNLSGPANKEPTIEVPTELTKYVGDMVSFTVKAQDPDKLDRISYGLEGSELANARIDANSGEFRWPADKIGEYEVVVAASDDGFPPKTAQQAVKIRITERPPDAPQEASVPKPSFELAKFAFVTAITEADGKRQAWISLRAEGKLLKLFEGDEFQIGEVTVKLTRIAEKAVELDAAVLEKRLQVTLGQNLAEGRDLTAAGT
ncbi:MAG: hypothetical protein MUE50_05405 [Pirellulaceae bacterium]|nr:hypothetical protein [Pirellulaceae bacterium]